MVQRIFLFMKKVGEAPVAWYYFVASFFFILLIRNFIEMFSDHTEIDFRSYLHFEASYVVIGLLLVLILHFFTREKIIALLKLVSAGFMVLWLPPLFDLLVSGGAGFDMTYLLPGQHDDLLRRFVTFFGSFDGGDGITPGIRLEVALVVAAAFIYTKGATGRSGRSLLAALTVYAAIFWYLSAPFSIRAFMGWFGLSDVTGNLATTRLNFFLLVMLPLLLILFYRLRRDYFVAVLRDIRVTRLLHYWLMFLLGTAISSKGFSVLRIDDALYYFIFLLIAIALAWVFAVMTNNIADQDIDAVSNTERPLIKKSIPLSEYKTIIWIVFILMIVYASLPGFRFLFLILCFTGSYWLYSLPPFRLKRVPVLSKISLGFNALLAMILGFAFSGGLVGDFPKVIIAVLLIPFLLGANFIDIKDYEGDKKAGIKTLPVLLGLRRAQLLIGLAWLMGYAALPFLLDVRFIWPVAALGGITCFWAITRRDYQEKWVFYPYLATLVFLFLSQIS